MSFGRQKNLMRRPGRADESFHRDRRRQNVDRLAMLEQPQRRSGLRALFEWIARWLNRRGS